MTQDHGSYHFPTFSIIYVLENAGLAEVKDWTTDQPVQ